MWSWERKTSWNREEIPLWSWEFGLSLAAPVALHIQGIAICPWEGHLEEDLCRKDGRHLDMSHSTVGRLLSRHRHGNRYNSTAHADQSLILNMILLAILACCPKASLVKIKQGKWGRTRWETRAESLIEESTRQHWESVQYCPERLYNSGVPQDVRNRNILGKPHWSISYLVPLARRAVRNAKITIVQIHSKYRMHACMHASYRLERNETAYTSPAWLSKAHRLK